jgi:Family of unknown function (DUF6325)
VLDLCVIAKDEQGNVTQRELSELGGEEATELSPLAGNVMGLLAEEDIQQLAADIPNESAAGLLLFEHIWAIGLKEAIKNSGAVAVTTRATRKIALAWEVPERREQMNACAFICSPSHLRLRGRSCDTFVR